MERTNPITPASMKLLGRANWYLPRWLELLPRPDHGGNAPLTSAPALERAA